LFENLNGHKDLKLVQKLFTDFLLLNILIFINKIFIKLRKNLVAAVLVSAFIMASCSNTQTVVPETSGVGGIK
jgi:predicted small secreted protein